MRIHDCSDLAHEVKFPPAKRARPKPVVGCQFREPGNANHQRPDHARADERTRLVAGISIGLLGNSSSSSGRVTNRSCSVYSLSTSWNARNALRNADRSKHAELMRQSSQRGSKHPTSEKSFSMRRTTSPILISDGRIASRRPPPFPRTVLTKPSRQSRCATFIIWFFDTL